MNACPRITVDAERGVRQAQALPTGQFVAEARISNAPIDPSKLATSTTIT